MGSHCSNCSTSLQDLLPASLAPAPAQHPLATTDSFFLDPDYQKYDIEELNHLSE